MTHFIPCFSAMIQQMLLALAIPHCRGRWFPITATRIGSDRLHIACRDDADLFSNPRGRVLQRIRVFGGKLVERSGEDIAGSLTVMVRLKGDRSEVRAPEATPGPAGAGTRTAFFTPHFAVRSTD